MSHSDSSQHQPGSPVREFHPRARAALENPQSRNSAMPWTG